MQTKIATALITIPSLLLAGMSIIQVVYAWNLLVGVRGAQSGHDKNIVVSLNGQNGYKDSYKIFTKILCNLTYAQFHYYYANLEVPCNNLIWW